jgi:hypothetical protein
MYLRASRLHNSSVHGAHAFLRCTYCISSRGRLRSNRTSALALERRAMSVLLVGCIGNFRTASSIVGMMRSLRPDRSTGLGEDSARRSRLPGPRDLLRVDMTGLGLGLGSEGDWAASQDALN